MPHLGSVRLVVNAATGDVVSRLDYDVWGNITSSVNPGFQPFGFAGGLRDDATGLVRFGARDYDPVVGRWTGRDPIGFNGGSPNMLSYTDGDPVNFLDITGEKTVNWFDPSDNPSTARLYRKTNDLVDAPGFFTIAAHGWTTVTWNKGIPYRTAKELETAIRAEGYTDGMPIRLLVCFNGNGERSMGSQLATQMKTLVLAPSGWAVYDGNGVMTSGVWNLYGPGGRLMDSKSGSVVVGGR